ncbi:MAG TPA: gluconate 2-dehydrogenase subunit 3 family protein [Candidatus Binatia bacterium]|nr:gluconate 2-dehydrogenase subunit 3 family protein [Candidatus Binatia bacterium]
MSEATEAQAGSTLSADDRRTLAAVLDEIIPATGDGALPGAGSVVESGLVDGTLECVPPLALGLTMGLAAVRDAARARGVDRFSDLLPADRTAVLNEVGEKDPGFVPTMMFVAYTTYYRDDRVLEALGLEARAPHPKGYDMSPCDLSLLDPVRRRPKLYRDV